MLHRERKKAPETVDDLNMAPACGLLTSLLLLRNVRSQQAGRRPYSTYMSSPEEGDPDQYTKFVASKSPEEWKWVEALLKPTTVPQPKPKTEYLSGWFPPAVEKTSVLPYYVPRNKNHMLPVYLEIKYNGQRKRTILRHVQGDIWALEKELMQYVCSEARKDLPSQVNELCRKISIKSDVYQLVERWLYRKGF